MLDDQISDARLVQLMMQRAFALSSADQRDARLLLKAAARLRELMPPQEPEARRDRP